VIRPAAELDIECYRNYFLVKVLLDGQFYDFPMYEGHDLDRQALVNLLAAVTIYTYNGGGYDLPMLLYALTGATCNDLKELNDHIIVRGLKPWDFEREYGIVKPEWLDHVDLMEVAPGVRLSLKLYAGRLHAPRMQDLPIDPSGLIEPIQRILLTEYCGNDLTVTHLLRQEVKDRIALRKMVGDKLRTDLRSKSDAQMAEAAIKARLDFRPDKRYIPHGFKFKYEPPAYVEFATPALKTLLANLRTADFEVTDREEAILLHGEETGVRTGVQIPVEIKQTSIRIGQATYKLGIGGLHSQESGVGYYADDAYELWDVDVKSYYPSLILTMGMFPTQVGPAFLKIYREFYDTRLKDKAEAERLEHLMKYIEDEETRQLYVDAKTSADGLKIFLNGTFGKLFSKYSAPLYAPELGIRVTMTGQLDLLMLIEMMELSGIQVVSANTDGIVLRVPRMLAPIARSNVEWWEKRTGLEMEYTHYRSIHFRDVNNYVAITTDGKVKRKGVFQQGGVLSGPQGKTPDKEICGDAVIAYLKDGTDPWQTISQCKDIRKFVVVRQVKGGGEYWPALGFTEGKGVNFMDGMPVYLGKAVRWYYSTNGGVIRYVKGASKVAGSDGAMPCMELPTECPTDIDYGKYQAVAMEMLADIGIPVRYWHHAESDSIWITLVSDMRDYTGDDQAYEIDRKTYDKRKKAQ
jgi:hypothetical protein